MPSKDVGPSVLSASQSSEEFAFFKEIVANLRDHRPKLIYADWLEERGDERAAFVREFVAACKAIKSKPKLPSSKNLPEAWVHMLGVPLIESVLESGFYDLTDVVLGLARPTIAVSTKRTRESQLAIGVSKFGGHPDLPPSVEWPRCEQGPLVFLGQIALNEFKDTQIADEIPDDGLLSFFAYKNCQTGYEPGVNGGFKGDTRVILTDDSQKLERHKPPSDLDIRGKSTYPACSISCWETWDLPNWNDHLTGSRARLMKRIEDDDDCTDALINYRERCHEFGHHLLGHSCHFRTDTNISPGPNWRHLFCFESDRNLDWSWGDGQHLSVFVHRNDLKNATFKRIYGYAA